MVIYNKGGTTWKDWVTNLLHQPDWKDKSIKIADVTKAILQTKSFGHTAQASSGEEKVHFLSRGRGGGQRGARGARGGARGGRGGGPPGRGAPSNFRPKICEKVPCTRPVSSPQHRFCTTCFKTVKKSEQEEADNGDLGANVAAEVRSKRHRKNKKQRAQDAARRRDAAATHEGKVIEVRETELTAQGDKSVKTESALQLSNVSKTKPSAAAPSCRSRKSVKEPKVVATIKKKLFLKKSIPIGASSEKAPSSTKQLVKKFKEKG
jgi:hypothetical protein